jgi:hypothetical protein
MNCANHSDIAAVAFCRTCGKPLCQTCTRDVRGVIYCESCLAARLEGTAPAAGFVQPPTNIYPPVGGPTAYASTPMNAGPNPTVAGILGAVPFGLGAVYCGQYAKGLIHLGIMVCAIVGVSSGPPWYVIVALSIFMGFFWVYQIIDSVRTARAIQMGEPVPDPLGLVTMFGGTTSAPDASASGGAVRRSEPAKIPIAAAVLIALGVLFLINTAFDIGLHRYWSLILIALGVYLFARNWGLIATYQPACVCERCRTRKLLGPALLITIGVMFLLHSVSEIGIGRTWPAILLVIGVVKLMQSNASYSGHVGPLPPGPSGYTATPPPAPGAPPASPVASQNSVPATEQPSSGEVKNV